MDQRPAEGHPDYGLVYRCDPLDTEMTIAGPVRVDLHVSSDCPDTDFVAKLVEETSAGEAKLLMDGVTRAMLRSGTDQIERLTPGEIVSLSISLGQIYHTVQAGSCLRVDITSSNFPAGPATPIAAILPSQKTATRISAWPITPFIMVVEWRML